MAEHLIAGLLLWLGFMFWVLPAVLALFGEPEDGED